MTGCDFLFVSCTGLFNNHVLHIHVKQMDTYMFESVLIKR